MSLFYYFSTFANAYLGSVTDLTSVMAALDGVYGAWINTDGFTIGQQKEIYAGIKIYEIAKRTPSLRHYIWSSLPYVSKVRQQFSPRLLVLLIIAVSARFRATILNTESNTMMARVSSQTF